jgi:hypothetical protein
MKFFDRQQTMARTGYNLSVMVAIPLSEIACGFSAA